MIKVFIRLGLIALLVYAGVTFWYGRVEKKMERKAPAETTQSAAQPEPKANGEPAAATDYSVILTRNIFQTGLEPVAAGGSGAGGGQGEETSTEDLAETRMQLVLLGTVTGSRDDARAVIRDQATKLEEIYRVGSELNGASIVRISRGKVVLKVNGREEVLTIKEPEAAGAGQRGGGMSMAPPRQGSGGGQPPQMETETNQKVPEALPRRRISFRNPEPSTQVLPPPEPQEPEVPPPGSDQAAPGEGEPPLPESPSPENGGAPEPPQPQ